MLEGIKSKLGFGGNDRDQQEEYYDDYDAEYGDEYGDGYDDGYEEYDDRGSDYRAEGSSRRAMSGDSGLYGSRSRASREISAPRLVSMEDVRARTQIPDSLKRDPLPPRRTSSYSSYRGERTTVDSSLPAVLTPEGAAAVSAAASAPRSMRSEGLNSLFEPSASEAADAQPRESRSSSYDPYEAYAGAASSSYSASRSLTVLKPVSYGEVERVAKTLKAGDVVVLCLRNTPDDLAKRILDFSFGVSAALDASVECPGEKVFALSRGKALTEAERLNLRNQGVL